MSKLLNATVIGEEFKISSQRVNLILSELGWIKKEVSGWTITNLGAKNGGQQFEYETTGKLYVLWPHQILNDKNLKDALRNVNSKNDGQKIISQENLSATEDFRERFPATFRTKDGHKVRSRAEVIIDDYLYDIV